MGGRELGSSQDLGRLPWLKAKVFAGQNENQLPHRAGAGREGRKGVRIGERATRTNALKFGSFFSLFCSLVFFQFLFFFLFSEVAIKKHRAS